MILEQYNYEVIYKSGANHKDVDHLSRYPIMRLAKAKRGVNRSTEPSKPTNHYHDSTPVNTRVYLDKADDGISNVAVEKEPKPPALTPQRIRKAQQQDEFYQKLITSSDRFTKQHGLIYELPERTSPATGLRLVIPKELVNDLIYSMHDDPLSGHLGYKKTLWRLTQKYYVKNASSAVKQYIKTCHFCQTRKSPWTTEHGFMKPLQVVTAPLVRVGVDTLGPFMKSYRANTKIIVITDYMTKWAIAKAVPRESEYEIAETLIEEIFLKFGTPDEILTDRGKSFNTEMIRIIHTEFNTKHITTTPYHPETNGLTERFNRTLSTMLSMYVNRHHRDWDEYLPYVVFAYNTVAQDSAGQSPYYLLFGMQARMLTDVDQSVNTSTLSEKFEHLHEARELAIRANQIAQRRQKEYYDRNRYSQEFEVNDLVLIHRSRGIVGHTTKLRHPYEGPFRVL